MVQLVRTELRPMLATKWNNHAPKREEERRASDKSDEVLMD